MARRTDPNRIRAAKLAGLRQRLHDLTTVYGLGNEDPELVRVTREIASLESAPPIDRAARWRG